MIGSAPATTLNSSLIWVSDRYIHSEGRVFVASSSQHRNFEELLVHELAHLLDHRFSPPAPGATPAGTPGWSDLDLESHCLVSTYAHESPSEHFAEALSAFLQLYAGRDTLAPEIRQELKNRLGRQKIRFFNRLLSPSDCDL